MTRVILLHCNSTAKDSEAVSEEGDEDKIMAHLVKK